MQVFVSLRCARCTKAYVKDLAFDGNRETAVVTVVGTMGFDSPYSLTVNEITFIRRFESCPENIPAKWYRKGLLTLCS